MAKAQSDYWRGEEGVARIEGWAREGESGTEIARHMGISPTTLARWREKYPEIERAVRCGREVADCLVEKALLRRALGYEYTETTLEESSKEPGKRRVTTKHVPPDLSAQIWWLKNRRPDRWKDKPPAGTAEAGKEIRVIDDV